MENKPVVINKELFLKLIASKATFKYKGTIITITDWGEHEKGDRYNINSRDSYIANVSKITSLGIRWYTFILGKEVSGVIKFSEIIES